MSSLPAWKTTQRRGSDVLSSMRRGTLQDEGEENAEGEGGRCFFSPVCVRVRLSLSHGFRFGLFTTAGCAFPIELKAHWVSSSLNLITSNHERRQVTGALFRPAGLHVTKPPKNATNPLIAVYSKDLLIFFINVILDWISWVFCQTKSNLRTPPSSLWWILWAIFCPFVE